MAMQKWKQPINCGMVGSIPGPNSDLTDPLLPEVVPHIARCGLKIRSILSLLICLGLIELLNLLTYAVGRRELRSLAHGPSIEVVWKQLRPAKTWGRLQPKNAWRLKPLAWVWESMRPQGTWRFVSSGQLPQVVSASAQPESAPSPEEREGVRRRAVEKLVHAGIERGEAAASVKWLLEAAVRSGAQCWREQFQQSVARRAGREPVQYILGSWPSFHLKQELLLRPPVLIPRPETEELVSIICESFGHKPGLARTSSKGPHRFLDIGSGSGIICISLLDQFPLATAVAVEPSPAAVALTEENARRCGVDSRLQVVQASVEDWAEHAKPGEFDLIVSNPPYIPSEELLGLQAEVRDFEDEMALDGGSDGLDIVRSVLSAAATVGANGAKVFLEVHHTHPAAFDVASANNADERNDQLISDGLTLARTIDDMFGNPRFVELEVKRPISTEAVQFPFKDPPTVDSPAIMFHDHATAFTMAESAARLFAGLSAELSAGEHLASVSAQMAEAAVQDPRARLEAAARMPAAAKLSGAVGDAQAAAEAASHAASRMSEVAQMVSDTAPTTATQITSVISRTIQEKLMKALWDNSDTRGTWRKGDTIYEEAGLRANETRSMALVAAHAAATVLQESTSTETAEVDAAKESQAAAESLANAAIWVEKAARRLASYGYGGTTW